MPTSETSFQAANAKLRRLAETACQGNPSGTVSSQQEPSPGQTNAELVHDLGVHQIELQMQNEELTRVNAALERSCERYFELYDLAPTGFCTVSEKGLILEANLSAANLLGLSRSAMIKQALSRFVLPEDQARYYQWREKVLQGGQPQACELRMKNSAGAPFWALINATAAGLASGSLTLRVVLSDVTERKNTEAALQKTQQRLRNLALRQQDEFDALRMDLAHDVHDQFGQNLAGLKLEIDGIRDTAPAAAARMQALIMQGASAIRDISRALRPMALELGLIHALHAMVAQISAHSDMTITSNLPKSMPCLSGQVERGLYRMAQEALSNAVRHANATEVQISLCVMAGRLKLEVRDDGQGFAPDSPSAQLGLGLLGMAERARQLGAKFSIQSTAATGTCVLIELRLATLSKQTPTSQTR